MPLIIALIRRFIPCPRQAVGIWWDPGGCRWWWATVQQGPGLQGGRWPGGWSRWPPWRRCPLCGGRGRPGSSEYSASWPHHWYEESEERVKGVKNCWLLIRMGLGNAHAIKSIKVQTLGALHMCGTANWWAGLWLCVYSHGVPLVARRECDSYTSR